MAAKDDRCSCSSGRGAVAAAQGLEEMDFARSLSGAAHAGDLARMKRLLQRGCCVEGGGGAAYSPLHYAARNGHLDACALLLRHGAKVDTTTRAGGATSLHRAAAAGQERVVELLLRSGAAPATTDGEGRTAAERAIGGGHERLAALIAAAAAAAAGDGANSDAERLP